MLAYGSHPTSSKKEGRKEIMSGLPELFHSLQTGGSGKPEGGSDFAPVQNARTCSRETPLLLSEIKTNINRTH